MTGTIFIASKDVYAISHPDNIDTLREHAYLVFDYDGSIATLDDQYFISGFPQTGETTAIGNAGHITIEVGLAYQESTDRLDVDVENFGFELTPEDRNYRAIYDAENADVVWQQMETFAMSLWNGADTTTNAVGGIQYVTSIPYSWHAANSNSVAASVLNSVGLDFRKLTPLDEGGSAADVGVDLDNVMGGGADNAGDFPGHTELLDGAVDETLVAYAYETASETILDDELYTYWDNSGADTIKVEYGARLEIIKDTDASTTNGVNLQGLVFANTTLSLGHIQNVPTTDMFVRTTGTLDPIVIANDQFGPDGTAIGMLRFYGDANNLIKQINLELVAHADLQQAPVSAAHIFTASLAQNGQLVVGMADADVGDLLYGDDHDNTLIGRIGNDTMRGGAGDDAYFWNVGHGSDAIIDSDGTNDVLDFGKGITEEMISGIPTSGSVTINVLGHSATISTQGIESLTGASFQNVAFTGEFSITTTNDIDGTHVVNPQTGQLEEVADNITGTAANDDIDGQGNNDTIDGTGGDDVIFGGAGIDNLSGGDDNDIIIGDADDYALHGDAGDDWLKDGQVMHGDAGNDYITTSAIMSGISVFGGADHDRIIVTANNGAVDGGEGLDSVRVTGNDNVVRGGPDTGENLLNDDVSDTIIVSGSRNEVYGGEGADVIVSTGGTSLTDANIIDGGLGNDVFHLDGYNRLRIEDEDGISGNVGDIVYNTGTVVLDFTGLTMDDLSLIHVPNTTNAILSFVGAYGESEILLGGYTQAPSSWLVSFDGSTPVALDAPVVTHELVTAGQSVIINAAFLELDAITTVDGHDTIYAGAIANTINSGSGQDLVFAGDGDDVVYGSNGADDLRGEDGADVLDGGEGNDTLNGGDGANTLYGQNGNDTMTATGSGTVFYGGGGNDAIRSFGLDQIIDGGSGDDTIAIDLLPGTQPGTATVVFSEGFDTVKLNSGGSAIVDFGGLAFEDLLFSYDLALGGINVTSGASSATLNIGDYNFHLWNMAFGGPATAFNIVDTTTEALTGDVDLFALSVIDTNDAITTGAGADTIWTYGGDDTVTAGDGENDIETGAGADTIVSGNGIDQIEAGDGDDTVHAGAGNDVITGGNGSDVLHGEDGGDIIEGGSGIDTIDGGDGDDEIDAGDGNDLIYGGAGSNNIFGQEGGDVIHGGGDVDTIYGDGPVPGAEDGNDTIYAGAGGDFVYAHGGNNEVHGGAGNDEITTGSGNDIIHGDDDNDTVIAGDGIDELHGGDGIDIMDGNEGDDTIFGDAGNDQLGGAEGNDTIDGGNGDDLMGGFEGNDTIIAHAGSDTVYGGQDFDVLSIGSWVSFENLTFSRATNKVDLLISITDGRLITVINQFARTQGVLAEQMEELQYGSGLTFDLTTLDFNHTPTAAADTFATLGTQTLNGNVLDDNGNGVDTDEDGDILSVQADTFTTGLGGSVTLLTDGSLAYTAGSGFTGLDTLNYMLDDGNGGVTSGSVSVFVADNAGNTLDGTSGDDTINGYGGNDSIFGNDGDDTIGGGEGDDTLRGMDGGDVINGDEGVDIILGGSGDDLIHGGADNDNLKGGSQNDTMYGDEGDDVVRGEAGKDVLHGGLGLDTINGGAGDDLMYGEDGNDSLNGGTGDDFIYGGAGNDTIRGEEGEDVLDGGEGDDDVRGGLDDNIVRGGDGNDTVYGGSSGGDSFVGNDELYGDAGNDQLFAGQGADRLDGGEGNDAMRGAEGSDIYVASAGSDYIYDSTGTADTLLLDDSIDGGDLTFTNGSRDQTDANDLVVAWNAQDSVEIENQNTTSQTNLVEKLQFGDGYTLTLGRYTTWTKGTASGETLSGNSSDNTILGFAGTDTLSGNDGHDELHGGDGVDTLNGGNGNDALHGGRDNDTLNGNSGHDTLYGGLGDDQVVGGSGNDIYVVTAGTDTITDADGSDTLRFAKDVTLEQLTFTNTGTEDVTIAVGSSATAVVKNQRGTATGRVENISFNDGLSLNFGDYTGWLFALAAGGAIAGTASADTVVGGIGEDEISGLEAADTLYGGAGIDTILGGDGNDVVHGGSDGDTVKGDAGADTVYGGAGNDTLFGESTTDDLMGDADVIRGGLGNDTAYGGGGDDDIFGEDGNDILYGQMGVDEISGGEGNDTIDGGAENDTLNGDDGDDIIAGGSGIDTINGGFGADTISGGDDSDIIDGGSGDDTIDGGAGGDTIHGGNGNDTIDGGASNMPFGETDTLFGDDGDDVIMGRDGDDTINGGTGSDILEGGSGVDALYGGLDADTFMFMAATAFTELDLIKDFVKETAPGDAEDIIDIKDLLIGYNGTAAAITNFLMMTTDGADTLVSVDRDGTGTAYGFGQIARIEGVTGLEDEQALFLNGNLAA